MYKLYKMGIEQQKDIMDAFKFVEERLCGLEEIEFKEDDLIYKKSFFYKNNIVFLIKYQTLYIPDDRTIPYIDYYFQSQEFYKNSCPRNSIKNMREIIRTIVGYNNDLKETDFGFGAIIWEDNNYFKRFLKKRKMSIFKKFCDKLLNIIKI